MCVFVEKISIISVYKTIIHRISTQTKLKIILLRLKPHTVFCNVEDVKPKITSPGEIDTAPVYAVSFSHIDKYHQMQLDTNIIYYVHP